jgi:hypothetical protein
MVCLVVTFSKFLWPQTGVVCCAQELQLTGLTQQLGPPVKLEKWMAKHALFRVQHALSEALGEIENTVQSVMPGIKALEVSSCLLPSISYEIH